MICRPRLADAHQQMVVIAVVGVDAQAIVATIAEGSTDDATVVLLRFPVEREHQFCMGRMAVACTITVGDDFPARL